MMRAVKDNKVYTITESQQKFYTDAGFDIVDDKGNIIGYGRGKTVPFEKYAALKEELEAAKNSGEINIGNVSTLAGLLKKLEEAGKE